MSKYTTEVRYICESMAGLTESEGFNSIDKILSKSTVKKIFNFDYPIFDENYRHVLNRKILQHFYTREIGEETVGLWQLRMCQTLNEIMPYYNKLYESEVYEINPYYNIDITKTSNREKGEDKKGTSYSDKSNVANNEKSTTYNNTENTTNSRNKTGTDKTDVDKTKTNTKNTVNNETLKANDVRNSTTKNTHSNTGTSDTKGSLVGKTIVNNNNTNTDRYSDTPQGGLQGMTAIKNNLYLTNARIVDDAGNTITDTTENTRTIGKTTDKGSESGTEKDTLNRTQTNAGTTNVASADYEKTNTSNNTTETNSENGSKNKSGKDETTEKINETGHTNGNTTEKIDTTEDYVEHIKGYKGNKAYAELIIEWRKSFLNIDRMILRDLEDCFFQLW